MHACIVPIKPHPITWGCNCCGQSCDLFYSYLGFDPLCALCHPRGALPAHWACRMFSGPWGIVVVRVSWLEHPTLIKKIKKMKPHPRRTRFASACNCLLRLTIFTQDLCLHRVQNHLTRLVFYCLILGK
jgi:hypothetical protein